MRNSKLIISSAPDGEDSEERPETETEVEFRVLNVGAGQHGMRLDQALADLVPEFSRSYLQQLLDLQAVTVNGKLARKSSARVKAGDTGVIELRPTPQSLAFRPEVIPLAIVYEDEHLLVINKPAGLVVHPAPGNWSGTLLNGLLAWDESARNLPRAGIVHRLDKDTSGLMVVARTRLVMDALVQLIAAREVARDYVALAGRPWVGPSALQINESVGRDPRNRLRMAVVDLERNAGKPARTDVTLLQTCAHGSLVRCSLHTGRTHQIRVHLASIGYPLVGDSLYGGLAAAGMQRQALHAYQLAFKHPATGQDMRFHAELPTDMMLALGLWGVSYNLF